MTQKGNFHNEPMETASKESIHEMQSRRLRAIVGTSMNPMPSTGIYSTRRASGRRISGQQRTWSGCL